MHNRILFTITVAVAATLLAGCAPVQDPAPTPGATVEPTTEPSQPTEEPTEEPATLEQQLDELRAQVAASSVGCDVWVVQTEGPVGSVGGTCDGVWTLFVFDTLESRNTVLVLNQESMEPQKFIVGPNWLIAPGQLTTAEELEALAAEFGYPVWDHTQPIPTS